MAERCGYSPTSPAGPYDRLLPITADLRRRWGVLTAQLHDALKSYSGTQLAADASQNIEQFLEFQTQANYSTPAQHKLAEYFRGRFATDTLPHLSTLPGANSCHHDHGRHLLVDGAGQITGVVGFGKVARTTHLYGIATACAYAGMNVPAPLDAMAEVIRGYMTVQPITHVEHLYNLIAVRLLAIAGTTTPAHPDCLLTTSATAAWALLARLKTIHPTLALAVFADAAAADLPLPVAHSYRSHQPEIVHPPVALQGRTLHRLDLSAGSTELGAATNYRDVRRFSQHIRRTLQRAGADYGYGGRAETRPVYTSEAFTETGNDGSRWRTVHLGIDIWGAAGTPVYAPIRWAGAQRGNRPAAAHLRSDLDSATRLTGRSSLLYALRTLSGQGNRPIPVSHRTRRDHSVPRRRDHSVLRRRVGQWRLATALALPGNTRHVRLERRLPRGGLPGASKRLFVHLPGPYSVFRPLPARYYRAQPRFGRARYSRPSPTRPITW